MYVDFIPNLVFQNIMALFIMFFGDYLTYGHDLTDKKTLMSKFSILISINFFIISVSAFIAKLEQLYYQIEEQMKEYLSLLNLLKEGLVIKTTVEGEDKILFANRAAIEILKKERGKVALRKSRSKMEINAEILS